MALGLVDTTYHRDVDALPWDTLRFEELDQLGPGFREMACDALVQVERGEVAALEAAKRLLIESTEPREKAFFLSMVDDETRHVAFFARTRRALGGGGLVRPEVEALMTALVASPSRLELLFSTHVMLEGLAHVLYAHLALVAKDLELEAARSVKVVIGDWLVKTVDRDELRHLDSGTAIFQAAWSTATDDARLSIAQCLANWRLWLLHATRDSGILAGIGVNGEAVYDLIIDDQNQRLSQLADGDWLLRQCATLCAECATLSVRR